MANLFSGLYEIVDQQCNAAQIAALLSTAKNINEQAKKDTRLTGSKKNLIDNLRYAVGKRHIKQADVYNLIRESEENGQQHVFYFRPNTKDAKDLCRDGTEVANRLFEEVWGSDYFPKFERKANKNLWLIFV